MDRPSRMRLSLGGLIVLVAIIAIGIAAIRPKTTKITEIKVGTGPGVKAGDTITVHYTGRLTDGKTFDSSKPRGQPFTYKVGGGMVIKGWELGIIGMKAGGVRQLTVPPQEGYGTRGVPPVIPPDATLIFDVELVRIQ